MSLALVRRALETAVSQWATANSIPVAWENIEFAPTATTYARAFMLPAETQSNDLGGQHRGYVGVFQVSLVMPNKGGVSEAQTLVASLDTYLSPASPLVVSGVRVYITSPVYAAPAIQEADRYVIPVSCRYSAQTY